MCAGHNLLPESLRFELPENTMGDVQYRGGFANVLKREWGNREIAVKVLRPQDFTPQEMTKVSNSSSAPISRALLNRTRFRRGSARK